MVAWHGQLVRLHLCIEMSYKTVATIANASNYNQQSVSTIV